MESEAEILARWRRLRDLLIVQLGRFESGALALHSGEENVTQAAIARLKQEIGEFDVMIGRSEARLARKPD